MSKFEPIESLEEDVQLFDLFVTIFAKHNHAIHVSKKRAPEFEHQIHALHVLGFITIQDHITKIAEHTHDLRTTIKGKQYLMDIDPVVLTRAFVRTRFIDYATYWLQKYIPISQLPEFLAHEDLFIRQAAVEKCNRNCTELIFPNEARY